MSYSRERSTAAWQKPAWIKHSFYSIPENSSGCTGSLRLIGEGLWWSHQSERNDSITPAEQSQMFPAFGLHSKRQDAWPGLLVLVWASGSEDEQRSLFLKESEFLTCRGLQNSCSGQNRAQKSFFSCLVFPSDISLNPKARAWMCWAVCCRGPNLCVHWPGGLELPFGVKKEVFF